MFDVHINGTQIWHKKEIGRFPEHHEVLDRRGTYRNERMYPTRPDADYTGSWLPTARLNDADATMGAEQEASG